MAEAKGETLKYESWSGTLSYGKKQAGEVRATISQDPTRITQSHWANSRVSKRKKVRHTKIRLFQRRMSVPNLQAVFQVQ